MQESRTRRSCVSSKSVSAKANERHLVARRRGGLAASFPRDAETVARAVERWDATGEGFVHAAGPAEYRLFVDAFVVVFFLDADVMHVAQVRHA